MRGTVIGFAVCVIASAAMLAASFWFKQRMDREYRANHNAFRAASQQYLAVDEEERIIEQFYPDFVRLYRAGLLGGEQRLSWLEALRTAGDAIKLPQLDFKLEAQREWSPDFDLPLGAYAVRASAMDLSLGLLHEGDILELFSMLDDRAHGQYSVRSCDFSAAGEPVALDPTLANIRAECKLDWLTVDLSGEQGLEL